MPNSLKELLQTTHHAMYNASQLAPCPLYLDGLAAINKAIVIVSSDTMTNTDYEGESVPDELVGELPQLVPTIGF